MAIAWIIQRRLERPLADAAFNLPETRELNGKLALGAILFGMGWGVGGLCPGPASLSAAAASTLPSSWSRARTTTISRAGRWWARGAVIPLYPKGSIPALGVPEARDTQPDGETLIYDVSGTSIGTVPASAGAGERHCRHRRRQGADLVALGAIRAAERK